VNFNESEPYSFAVGANAETVAAMKAAPQGETVKAGKPDKLLRSLNAGD
jgi:hypothetical protein